jgi:hypothetical protein
MAKTIKMTAEDKKYQAKWDLDTLRQADEIRKNAARLKAAQSVAKEQIMALGGIVGNSQTSKSTKGGKVSSMAKKRR